MRGSGFESVLGGIVLIVAGAFLAFALNTAQVSATDGYDIRASFLKVGGLSKGSDVRMNGIKVGTVRSLELDRDSFDAVVTMTIRSDIQLPADSVASIGSSGIIGGKFVSIKPGGSSDRVAEGGELKQTEDFKSLEDQVGEIIFLATGSPN